MSEIEMEDLSRPPVNPADIDEPAENTISYWAYASAVVLIAIASSLTVFPRILLFLSQTPEEQRAGLTHLEEFLAHQFGAWLFGLAASLLINCPSSSPISIKHAKPTSHPLLGCITVTSLFTAFSAYNDASIGSLSTVFFLGAATIGLWGLWAIIFEGSSNFSKKTGADKHTSSFLFKNKASATEQKRRWRKDHGLSK